MKECIPYYVSNGFRSHNDMDELLEVLQICGTPNKQEFLKSRGPQKVTLVHLAAYSGNLRILEHAGVLGLDVLYAMDGSKRIPLHHAAFKGQVDVLEWLLNRVHGTELLEFRNSDGDTALHEAVKGLRYDPSRASRKFNLGNVEAVRLLVEKGANVEAPNALQYPPLLVAGHVLVSGGGPHAAMWFDKIVEILVSASASVNLKLYPSVPAGYNILECAITLESIGATMKLVDHGAHIVKPRIFKTLSVVTALHLGAAGRCHEILRILAEKVDPAIIDIQNSYGMTPLHCAVQTGHPKNFCSLVDHGASLLAMNFQCKTVLQVLFGDREDPVAYLTEGLNSQIRLQDNEIVNLNFKVLLPPGKLQMEVISALISAIPNMEEMTILQHPLLDAFLRLKWSKFRWFFFILCTLHACVLVFLFWYAVVLLRTELDSSLPRRLLLPCAIILLFHNVLLFLTMPRHYVQQFEQWFSMICVTMLIGVGVAGELIPGTMTAARQAAPWLLNSVSVAILFAGIQMMLIIGRFPTSGFYTLMFFTVLKNVVKLFLVFACLILSFAFSFMIIFHEENQFHNPWLMVVKTVVMMTGEYDYGDHFTSTNKENSMGNTITAVMGGIVFLLFVMFANIVLMNLITALAVTDVQQLVKKGELLGSMKQVEFMAQFERVTAHWIFLINWMPNCLKKIINRDINVELSLRRAWSRPHWEQFAYRPRCIPENLMKTLFALGKKNWDSDEKSQKESSPEEPEADLSEIILDVQRQIRELDRDNRFYRRRIDMLSREEPGSDRIENPPPVPAKGWRSNNSTSALREHIYENLQSRMESSLEQPEAESDNIYIDTDSNDESYGIAPLQRQNIELERKSQIDELSPEERTENAPTVPAGKLDKRHRKLPTIVPTFDESSSGDDWDDLA